MKAVVVELRGSKAAALKQDGTVVLVPNKNYEVGQELSISAGKSTVKRAAVWGAAAAALVISLGAGLYQTPYSYMSVDVNPSIAFSLNCFDRVIHVNAMNGESQRIVDGLLEKNVTNLSADQALSLTLNMLAQDRYFENADETPILIASASQSSEKANILADELAQTVRTFAGDAGGYDVEVVSGSLDEAAKASDQGVTLGRKRLVDEIESRSSSAEPFPYQEWAEKPLGQLVKENRKLSPTPASRTASQPEAAPSPAAQPRPQSHPQSQQPQYRPGPAAGFPSKEGQAPSRPAQGRMPQKPAATPRPAQPGGNAHAQAPAGQAGLPQPPFTQGNGRPKGAANEMPANLPGAASRGGTYQFNQERNSWAAKAPSSFASSGAGKPIPRQPHPLPKGR